MIISLKPKKYLPLIIAVIFVISFLFSCSSALKAHASPAPKIIVAIDAGHGGIDGGSVGTLTGKDENFLNLEYALTLEGLLNKFSVGTVMTRSTLAGLYSPFAENKKLDDMAARKNIVLESGANVLISIHMNSFPLSSSRGAQVFYKAGDQPSSALAQCIQNAFIQALPAARKTTSVGDYYMLNEFSIPAVIVECGYLSNPEEEALLVEKDYQNLVCSAIFVGIVQFLSN